MSLMTAGHASASTQMCMAGVRPRFFLVFALHCRPPARGMISSYRLQEARVAAAVKKTISLPAELAREAEALAKAEGKTLSAVVQDALRHARVGRRLQELRGIQGYWSRKARDQGILSEQDLERYLRS